MIYPYPIVTMSIASSCSVAQAFLCLCNSDHRLRKTIQSITVITHADGMSALIQPHPGQSKWLRLRLVKIARYLLSLGDFKTITIDSKRRPTTYLISDLVEICPKIYKGIESNGMHRVKEAQFLALMQYQSRRCSAFLISLSGVYLDVMIHQGTDSKISPELMRGKPIADFVGKETASVLLQSIHRAYRLVQFVDVHYSITYPDGETREYTAELVPAPGTESVIALVNRLK